jgi:hypothetical protein
MTKHPGRHVWRVDFHDPGPRTYLKCRKCGLHYDTRKDAKQQKDAA